MAEEKTFKEEIEEQWQDFKGRFLGDGYLEDDMKWALYFHRRYRELSERTLPDRPKEANLSMLALGLTGEAAEVWLSFHEFLEKPNEVRKKDLADELGDWFWYSALLAELADPGRVIPLYDNNVPGPGEAATELMLGSGIVAEHIKKMCYHGREYSVEELENEGGYYDFFTLANCAATAICWCLDVTPSAVMARNVLKLEGRWPDGFEVVEADTLDPHQEDGTETEAWTAWERFRELEEREKGKLLTEVEQLKAELERAMKEIDRLTVRG